MAQFTPNYDLVKPAQEDFYNVDDQNRNTDEIDTALKAHDDSLAGKADLGEDGKVKPEQLTPQKRLKKPLTPTMKALPPMLIFGKL